MKVYTLKDFVFGWLLDVIFTSQLHKVMGIPGIANLSMCLGSVSRTMFGNYIITFFTYPHRNSMVRGTSSDYITFVVRYSTIEVLSYGNKCQLVTFMAPDALVSFKASEYFTLAR